ncbi:MAG: DUF192 domain-containing protein [Xanthomonadales bacterium]|nr:DUF192 domain-containing protein [Xanthomonadales bacterium]
MLLLLAGCPTERRYRQVELGGEVFVVEIADDDRLRERGLMWRDELPADHGMLFVWEDEAHRTFWMKNTRLALDILHFDGERRLVDLQLAVPPCRVESCPTYTGLRPARYVLELPAGTAARLGLRLGDRFDFVPR